MAVEIQANTPLAESLQNAVQNKLMELGWTSGGLDDTSLAEYIVLMLVSGKTEEEVSSDLKNDILGDLNTEGTGAPEFAGWLFQQVEALSGQPTGQQDIAVDGQTSQAPFKQEVDDTQQNAGSDAQDMAMDEDINEPQPDGSMYEDPFWTDNYIYNETNEQYCSPPTGPKSMRNGKQRDKRMLGHMNRALDRSGDQVMHRIKGAANAGRINSHSNREPPKGPAPKGPRATMQRIANATPQRQMQQMQQMNPSNPLGQMTREQQAQLFAMYEQQAKMMAQIFNPTGQPPQPQQSKSLFDRVDTRTSRNPKFSNSHPPSNGITTTGNDQLIADANSSMEVETASQTQKQDISNTMCRFNLACTKADCIFVHQSPAAPPGTAIDMTDTCSFGASCKNRKCTARHPSPASLSPMDRPLSSTPSHGHAPYAAHSAISYSNGNGGGHDTRPDCRFYPHCTNPSCPFKHPSMPPCRNGADCTVPACHFYHNATACKYDPCLNPACPFKHAEGQKRGSYKDKVWTSGDGDAEEGKEHVSERKFVDEGMDEELVRGDGDVGGDGMTEDASVKMENAQSEGIIT